MTKNFYSLINNLKFLKRQGWVSRGLEADSIGSHNFGAIALGWYLASQQKVNVSRVIEMLTVHDLVMAKMEDVTPGSGKYSDKRALENKAKRVVSATMPKSLGIRYLKLFEEFNSQKTIEAKIAREADKLETLFQAENYETQTDKRDILDEFLVTYSSIFTTKLGKKLFIDLNKRHLRRKK